MKQPTQTTLLRIIYFIPTFLIILFYCTILFIKMLRNYIMYGGESIIYNDKVNRKTVLDVYMKIEEAGNQKYSFEEIKNLYFRFELNSASGGFIDWLSKNKKK